MIEFSLPISMFSEFSSEKGSKVSGRAAFVLAVPQGSEIKEVLESEGGQFQVKIGVFHTVDEFVARALTLRHPFDGTSGLNPDLLHAVFTILTKGPAGVKEWRSGKLLHYMKRAAALHKEEKILKAGIPGINQKVVAKKRLLLFKEMMRDAGIDDPELVKELSLGLRLVGRGSDSPEFPAQDVPPALDVSQARGASKWVRAAARGKAVSPEDLDLARQVWDKSKEELDQGWLRGPLTEEQLRLELGDFLVSRRFGIRQGDGVRVIDDFTEGMANHAFYSPFKARFDSLDEIVVLAKTFLEAVRDDGKIHIPLPNGGSLDGSLHPSLTVTRRERWLCAS